MGFMMPTFILRTLRLSLRTDWSILALLAFLAFGLG